MLKSKLKKLKKTVEQTEQWKPSVWKSDFKYAISISILPYLNIQYFKHQGKTSSGCIKIQLNGGWIIWNFSFYKSYK
jgi:hypothetical protein